MLLSGELAFDIAFEKSKLIKLMYCTIAILKRHALALVLKLPRLVQQRATDKFKMYKKYNPYCICIVAAALLFCIFHC